MTSEQKKDTIMQGLKWGTYPKQPTGGQSCGKFPTGVKLSHPDFDFEVSINHYRTQFQNREMAATLFELFVSEALK